MKIYKYDTPEKEIEKDKNPMIFLAGPTIRAHQRHLGRPSWREEAIKELEKQKVTGSIVIPEFPDQTVSDKGKKWVPLWEFNGLKTSDCILFWIPRTKEIIGLTTNWELGYWVGRNRDKIVYGRPDEAYRIDYLDTMWEAIHKDYNKTFSIYNTLENTIKASIEMAILRNDIAKR